MMKKSHKRAANIRLKPADITQSEPQKGDNFRFSPSKPGEGLWDASAEVSEKGQIVR